jgi:hypothetical protein
MTTGTRWNARGQCRIPEVQIQENATSHCPLISSDNAIVVGVVICCLNELLVSTVSHLVLRFGRGRRMHSTVSRERSEVKGGEDGDLEKQKLGKLG